MSSFSHHHALALPELTAAIPVEYRVPGGSGLCAPLAVALLEMPALTNRMFSLAPNALLQDVFKDENERDLASRALTSWWSRAAKRYPSTHFKWELMVCDKITSGDTDLQTDFSDRAWFCLGRSSKVDIPRFSLARATEKLESSLEGFGQTVLAVLYDALRRLPESLTPLHAHEWAEQLHWSESENDAEMLRLAKINGDPREDLLTRERFFKGMPKWVVAPQRVVTREAIVRASREGFEAEVIAACDAIYDVVSAPDFMIDTSECGTRHMGADSYEACLVLAWKEFDRRGEVIDEWLNMIVQSGEAVDQIDIVRVELTSAGVANWMRRTEQMLQLAQATERLVVLIGEPF